MIQKLSIIFFLFFLVNDGFTQQVALEINGSGFINSPAQINQKDLPNLNGTGLSAGLNKGSGIELKLDFTFVEKYSFFLAGTYGRSTLNLNAASSRTFYTALDDADVENFHSFNSTSFYSIKTGGSLSWNLKSRSQIKASLGLGSFIPLVKKEYFGAGDVDHSQYPYEFYQYYQGVYEVNEPLDFYFFINPEVQIIQDVRIMDWDIVLGVNSMISFNDYLHGQVVFFSDSEELVSRLSDRLNTIAFTFGIRYNFKKRTFFVK